MIREACVLNAQSIRIYQYQYHSLIDLPKLRQYLATYSCRDSMCIYAMMLMKYGELHNDLFGGRLE